MPVNTESEIKSKFIELMKDIFDLNQSELDFGIYKIINAKRNAIEDFIKNQIPSLVQENLSRIQANTADQITQIYNDLFSFFSMYYHEGDFLTRRRIKSHKYSYAIPYDGNEVALYWANHDQYYIKSSPLVRQKEFRIDNLRFVLRLANTSSAVNLLSREYQKIKQTNFQLSDENPIEITENKCVISFILKPTNDKDNPKGKNNEYLSKLQQEIIDKVRDIRFKQAVAQEVFLKQLRSFTAVVSTDFFIHKNLRGFLYEQLDYYLKTSILDIDALDNPRHLARAKVVREVAQKIIDFLDQIEEFQKILWEKRKFVIMTEYVITTDKIPQELWDEILKNREQLKEWESLELPEIKTKDDLKGKFYPVDTRHFPPEFKERLLSLLSSKFSSLDDALDGILIKSENWQTLNLILPKFYQKVQTIYIDPPFNTGDNEFIYKNNYLDSCWCTMMYDRLDMGKRFLKNEGSIFVRIDYHGNHYVRLLMNKIFGEENFRNELVISRISKQDPKVKRFNTATDTLYLFSKSDKFLFKPLFETLNKTKGERWHAMDSQGQGQGLYIFGYLLEPPKGRHWTYGQENINQMELEQKIRLKCRKCGYVHTSGTWNGCPSCKNQKDVKVEYLLAPTEKKQVDSNWTRISGYTFNWDFQGENSEVLLKRVIESTSNEGDIIMDYFLGSGTTTAVAHKLKRKWIGAEVGDYFWTVTLPRMKKVLFYDETGISKEKDVKEKYNKKNAGGFFKYHCIEQYEDTLQNISFNEEKRGAVDILFQHSSPEKARLDYEINSSFFFEAKDSISFPSARAIPDPFNFKMKVISLGGGEKEIPIDLIESFNYVASIKVDRYMVYFHQNRKYVFILGGRDAKPVAVIWRNFDDIEEKSSEERVKILEDDKEFIEKTLSSLKFEPAEIWANYDAVVKDYKNIEQCLWRLISQKGL